MTIDSDKFGFLRRVWENDLDLGRGIRGSRGLLISVVTEALFWKSE
ncbi:MAG: hypothetical protein U0527_17890 [Candidatus Eisenbacteria bacterium]